MKKGKEPLKKKGEVTSKLNLEKKDKSNLIILFAIGVATRLYAFCAFFMISLDGAFQYIPVAKLFYHGDYLRALQQPQLPLYPFLISIVTRLTGNFELSGQLLSIIFSLAAILPLYLIGKFLFNPKAGFWATIVYLINPLMLHCSVDVLKEGLLVFLFLSAVYCSLRFLQDGTWRWLLWTVAFSVAGALVSVIAVAVLVVLGVWVGYRVLRGEVMEEGLPYRYLWVLMAVVGIIVIFLIPGLLSWEFWITKKPYKVIEDMLYRWFVYEWPRLSQVGASSLSIVGRFLDKAYPLPLLVAFFGIGWRVKAKEFSAAERYLALMMGVLIVIFFPTLYASGRYHLPAIVLLYLWTGFGFVKIPELIERRFTRYKRLAVIALVAILLGNVLPNSLKPQRLDKIGYKKAGLWLRENTLTPPLILTDDPRVAYYADGTYLFIPPEAQTEEIVAMGKTKEADFLVIEGRGTEIADAYAPFEKTGALKLVLRHPHGWKGKIVYVYKVKK